MAEPILEARAVSKSYAPRGGMLCRPAGAILAVDRVRCALQPGETVGLVGESGCGKTTLARLLVGLIPPTAGTVFIRGEPLAQLRGASLRQARRAVQLVFQDPANSLNPRMAVEQTLSEPLAIHRIARGAARRARVAELLEAVQLPRLLARRFPRELSGGERQRVGIARALATGPDALICDEPIASLDVSVGARVLQLLRRLCRARGMALLFISHDLGAVASLCERLLVMSRGRIIEEGPADTVLTRPRDPYTRLLIRSASLDLDASPYRPCP